MQRKKKFLSKLLALMLSAIMIASALPVVIAADEGLGNIPSVPVNHSRFTIPGVIPVDSLPDSRVVYTQPILPDENGIIDYSFTFIPTRKNSNEGEFYGNWQTNPVMIALMPAGYTTPANLSGLQQQASALFRLRSTLAGTYPAENDFRIQHTAQGVNGAFGERVNWDGNLHVPHEVNVSINTNTSTISFNVYRNNVRLPGGVTNQPLRTVDTVPAANRDFSDGIGAIYVGTFGASPLAVVIDVPDANEGLRRLPSAGRTFRVGPGQEFTDLTQLRDYVVALGSRGGNFANLNPGDTILVYPNVVDGRNIPHLVPDNGRLWLNANGTEEAPITLRGVIDADGNRPIISVRTNPAHTVPGVFNHSVITIGSGGGANHSGDHIIVRDVIVDGGVFEMFDFFNNEPQPGNRFFERFGAPSGMAFSERVTLENFPVLVTTPFENSWFADTTRFGNRTYGTFIPALAGTPHQFMMRTANNTGGHFANRAVFIEAGNHVTLYNILAIGGGVGITSGDGGPGTIVVDRAETAYNGMHGAGHNMYFNGDQIRFPDLTLTVRNSFIHNSIGTQGLRTRVGRNLIYNNFFLNNTAKQVDLVGHDAFSSFYMRPNPPSVGGVYREAQIYLGIPVNENIPHWESVFDLPRDTEFIGNVSIMTGPFHSNHVHIGGAGQATEESWGRYRFINNTFLHLTNQGNAGMPREAVGARFGLESVEFYNNVFYSRHSNFRPFIEETYAHQAVNEIWSFGVRQVTGSNNWIYGGAVTNIARGTPDQAASAPRLEDLMTNTTFGDPGEWPFISLAGHHAPFATHSPNPAEFDLRLRNDSTAYITGAPVGTTAEFMTLAEYNNRLANEQLPLHFDWAFEDGELAVLFTGGWGTPYPMHSTVTRVAPWRGLGFGDAFYEGHWTWQPPVNTITATPPSNFTPTTDGWRWAQPTRADSNAPILGAFLATDPPDDNGNDGGGPIQTRELVEFPIRRPVDSWQTRSFAYQSYPVMPEDGYITFAFEFAKSHPGPAYGYADSPTGGGVEIFLVPVGFTGGLGRPALRGAAAGDNAAAIAINLRRLHPNYGGGLDFIANHGFGANAGANLGSITESVYVPEGYAFITDYEVIVEIRVSDGQYRITLREAGSNAAGIQSPWQFRNVQHTDWSNGLGAVHVHLSDWETTLLLMLPADEVIDENLDPPFTWPPNFVSQLLPDEGTPGFRDHFEGGTVPYVYEFITTYYEPIRADRDGIIEFNMLFSPTVEAQGPSLPPYSANPQLFHFFLLPEGAPESAWGSSQRIHARFESQGTNAPAINGINLMGAGGGVIRDWAVGRDYCITFLIDTNANNYTVVIYDVTDGHRSNRTTHGPVTPAGAGVTVPTNIGVVQVLAFALDGPDIAANFAVPMAREYREVLIEEDNWNVDEVYEPTFFDNAGAGFANRIEYRFTFTPHAQHVYGTSSNPIEFFLVPYGYVGGTNMHNLRSYAPIRFEFRSVNAPLTPWPQVDDVRMHHSATGTFISHAWEVGETYEITVVIDVEAKTFSYELVGGNLDIVSPVLPLRTSGVVQGANTGVIPAGNRDFSGGIAAAYLRSFGDTAFNATFVIPGEPDEEIIEVPTADWMPQRALNEHMVWAPRTQNSLFVPFVDDGPIVSYPFYPGLARGQFTMEFDVHAFDNVNGHIAFGPYASHLYWTAERAICLRLTPAGFWQVNRGTVLVVTDVPYTANHTHNVRVYVDLTADSRGVMNAAGGLATWNGMFQIFVDDIPLTVDADGNVEWWAIRNNAPVNTNPNAGQLRQNLNNVSRWHVDEVDTPNGALNFDPNTRTDRGNLNLGTIGALSNAGHFVVKGFQIDGEDVPLLMAPYYDWSDFPSNLPSMVRPSGSNLTFNVGPTREFRKIQDVLGMLLPGDTVIVDGDWAYPAPIFVSQRNGGRCPDTRVTFRGVPGASGTLPVISTLNAQNLFEVPADYITIESFIMIGNQFTLMDIFGYDCYDVLFDARGWGGAWYAASSRYAEFARRMTDRGIFQRGTGLVIRYNDISDTNCGILSSDSDSGDILIEFNRVHRNGIAGAAHNIYLATGGAHYRDAVAIVRYNVIERSMNGNGLKTRAIRNEVYYNLFYDNKVQDLEVIGMDPGIPSRSFLNENRFGGTLATTKYNAWRAYENGTGPLPNHADNFGPMATFGNHTHREDADVVGNLFINTRGAGLGFVRMGGDGTGHSYGRYRFVNNTFAILGTEGNSRIFRIEFGTESFEAYNNLIYSVNPLTIVVEPTNIGGHFNNIPNQPWHTDLGRQVFGYNNAVFAPGITNIGYGMGIFYDEDTNTGYWHNNHLFLGSDFVNPFVNSAAYDFRLTTEFAMQLIGTPIEETLHVWPEYDTVTRRDWCPCHITSGAGGHAAPIGHSCFTAHPAGGTGNVYGWVYVQVPMRDRYFPNAWLTLESQLNPSRSAWFGPVSEQFRTGRTDGAAPTIGAFSTTLPEFGWHIFNNGPGGTQYPRPNPGLAASGTIRLWTQLDGVNAPIRLTAADTIVALDQNGQCAMEFVTVNQMWVAGTGWIDYFNMVNVNKNGDWQYINLSITVLGQTVHVLLVNALFEPPVLPEFGWNIFNNGPGGTQYPRPNAGLAASGTIRMWAQLDGVNAPVYLDAADTIVATDQDGECAMQFVRVNRVWVAGQGWADYFNMVDVNKNGDWQYINLSIAVYGETVHVLLVNALFVPPTEDVTVTFVVEAGAVGVYAATTTYVVVPAGEEIPAGAMPNTQARTGFYFAGWYPSDPAGYVVTEDITFTARFNPLFHYVTFEAGNGGELVPAAGFGLVVSIRDGFTFWADRVPTPVADAGYVFIGWYPADPAGFVVRDSMTFTALFVVPQIVSVLPNPAVVEQGGEVELVVTTLGMPDGAWVDMNVWRPGLSVVGGPRFYIVDGQATITVAAAADAQLGLDGFSVAARTAGDWGSVILIHSYAIVIEVI